ncbi:MFS transporter [Halovenus rubra]|uniref:MFS transporter n=2 Tax=Halovenus rubra TaxID=869890 RepID=A0ABD5X3S8_9EURY|nr:MFS transporter [Halovenus rubra]
MARWSANRTVLVACTLAFFATMVARLVISPVVPAIADNLDVSNADIGLALSGMWLSYALSQFPSGLLGDRYGERVVILVAVGGTALASFALALSPTFGVFMLLTVVLGGVAGLHYSVATTLLSRLFSNTGTAIGVHSAGAPIAGLLAPVVAAYLGSHVSWRHAVSLGAVAAVPATALVAHGIAPVEPRRPNERIRDRLDIAAFGELLTRPPIAGTMVVSVLAAFVWQGTASFLPTFLVEHRGYSEPVAGAIFSGYFVVQGVGQPGMGWLSDRIGRDAAMVVCSLAGVGGYALYVRGPGLASVMAATVLVGIAMSWGATMLPKFIDNMEPEEEGVGFGLIRTTYMVFGASGSFGVGLLADSFNWAVTFLTLSGILGSVAVALIGAAVRRRLL